MSEHNTNDVRPAMAEDAGLEGGVEAGTRRRGVIRRIARWIGIVLGGVLGLVVLAVAAGLIWLRTESAENLIREKALEAMAGAGLPASMEKLEGPLPGTLRVTGLIMSDSQGEWLYLDDFILRLSLLDLFRARVTVAELGISGVNVLRTPMLPPSSEPEEPVDENADPLAVLAPENLRSLGETIGKALGYAAIENLHLDRVNLGEGLAGSPVTLNLRGSGPLTDLRLQYDIATPLLMSLFPQAKTEQVQEKTDSVVAEGKEAEDTSPFGPHLAGSIFVGNEGEWLDELAQNGIKPAVALFMDAAGPEMLLAEIPGEISAVVERGEQPVRLDLLLTLHDAEVAVQSLNVHVPGADVNARHLAVTRDSLAGSIALAMNDPATLVQHFAPDSGTSLPLAGATANVAFSGSIPDPKVDLRAAVDGMDLNAGTPDAAMSTVLELGLAARDVLSFPALKASGQVKMAGGPLAGTGPLILRIEDVDVARTEQGLDVRTVRLLSDLLNLDIAANLGEEGKLDAAVKLDIPGLKQLAACAAGFVPALAEAPLNVLDGNLDLDVRAARSNETSPIAGTLDLAFGGMVWGIPQAQALLGTDTNLNVAFSVLPQENGTGIDIGLNDLSLVAEQIRLDGSVSLGSDQNIRADVLLNVASLDGLDAGVTGSVVMAAHADGPLDNPSVALDVSSPSLGVGTAVLEQLKLDLQAAHIGASGGEGQVNMTCSVDVPGVNLGRNHDFSMNTDWAFTPEHVSLQQTTLGLPGLKLGGSLDAVLGQGSPELNADFSLDIKDWRVLSAMSGIPLNCQPGQLKLRAEHKQNQNVSASWKFGSLGMDGFSLASLNGRADVTDLFGNMAVDAEIKLGAGSVSGGEFGWNRGSLNALGDLDKLDLDIDLVGKTALQLQGALNVNGNMLSLTRLDFLQTRNKSNKAGVRLLKPARIAFGSGITLEDLELAVTPAGSISAGGQLGSGAPSLQASIKDIPLKIARVFSSASLPDGVLACDVSLGGKTTAPVGKLNVSLTGLGYPESELPPASVRLDGEMNVSGAAVSAVLDGFGDKPATMNVNLPLKFGADGMPEPVMNKNMSGSVHWAGSLPALWRFVPLANTAMYGDGSLDAEIGGTLSKPQITAALKLVKASFEDIFNGVLVADINTDVNFTTSGNSTLAFSATDGREGSIAINGTIGSPVAGMPLDIRGKIENMAPLHRNDLQINLSGDLAVKGPADALDVDVGLTINSGQFLIMETFGSSIPTLEVVDAGTPEQTSEDKAGGPNLNVRVTLPGKFFVRGAGLDSEWKGDLQVTGPAANPAVSGSISSVRGKLDLLGKPFVLTKGEVLFDGGTPPNPMLDVQVTYTANIIALATVSGSASAPVLTLTSQPALPQDEIVSQILFGQSSASLGRMEAIQLAAEVASLAGFGRGKGGVLGEVRESVGVDVLRFGTMQKGDSPTQSTGRQTMLGPNQSAGDTESVPSLEMGKYITDDIYVGFEQGMNGDAGGVRVEVELTPNLNFTGSTKAQDSEVGLNWKKDY